MDIEGRSKHHERCFVVEFLPLKSYIHVTVSRFKGLVYKILKFYQVDVVKLWVNFHLNILSEEDCWKSDQSFCYILHLPDNIIKHVKILTTNEDQETVSRSTGPHQLSIKHHLSVGISHQLGKNKLLSPAKVENITVLLLYCIKPFYPFDYTS